jgi:hypothetical protein
MYLLLELIAALGKNPKYLWEFHLVLLSSIYDESLSPLVV